MLAYMYMESYVDIKNDEKFSESINKDNSYSIILSLLMVLLCQQSYKVIQI